MDSRGRSAPRDSGRWKEPGGDKNRGTDVSNAKITTVPSKQLFGTACDVLVESPCCFGAWTRRQTRELRTISYEGFPLCMCQHYLPVEAENAGKNHVTVRRTMGGTWHFQDFFLYYTM